MSLGVSAPVQLVCHATDENCAKQILSDAVHLDFQTPLDKIPHETLPKKLHSAGIQDSYCAKFRD